MSLRLPDKWLWDFWLTRDGSDHHLFFLQAPKSIGDPDQRHWNVSVGHAVSTDLTHWRLLPDVLEPDSSPAWDDCTTWTGSVIRHDGQWWMFYTGTSHSENGKIQRIGAAVSDDLFTWRRHSSNPLIEADPRWYERYDPRAWPEEAWRDPWIVRDEQGRFHAFITARAASSEPATRGVIGHAESDDLVTWTVRPPVTVPGRFGHLEIPQVELVGGRWRLIFSAPPPVGVQTLHPATRIEGTHILTGSSLTGPFEWSTHRVIDGTPDGTHYGGRLVRDDHGGTGWRLLTWLNHGLDGTFVGELDDPVPVQVGDDYLAVVRSSAL